MTRTERITRARIHLLLEHPFFGTLATKLRMQENAKVKTTSTNGLTLDWNPAYLDSLSDQELQAVIAHDVMHAANGHNWRRGSRDNAAWDKACDMAINGILRDAGFQLPAAEPLPPAGTPTKSAEGWYNAPESDGGAAGGQGNPENSPAGDESGENGQPIPSAPGCGAVEDAPANAAEAGAGEEDWKIMVAQAAAIAQAHGKLPGSVERMIGAIVSPSVPWETILRDFIDRAAKNDYNWMQPNRRYLGRGVILPSLISNQLPEIVLAIDTSGSINQKIMDKFAAEASAILGAYETVIRIVYADSAYQGDQTVTRAELPLQLAPKGGGGTDFAPVFKWVEDEAIAPACLIYLTDLYGGMPAVAPEYPVLWVCISDKCEVPFGDVIKMEV